MKDKLYGKSWIDEQFMLIDDAFYGTNYTDEEYDNEIMWIARVLDV